MRTGTGDSRNANVCNKPGDYANMTMLKYVNVRELPLNYVVIIRIVSNP